MIALLKEYDREKIKLLKKKELTSEEKKDIARLSRNANLVNENGQRACMTLAGRGIGPDAASRILGSVPSVKTIFFGFFLSLSIIIPNPKLAIVPSLV